MSWKRMCGYVHFFVEKRSMNGIAQHSRCRKVGSVERRKSKRRRRGEKRASFSFTDSWTESERWFWWFWRFGWEWERGIIFRIRLVWTFLFILNHREDDTALLMKELERVKKEKELAKQKEVILLDWMNDRKKKRRKWKRLSIARRWFTRIRCYSIREIR